MLLGLIQEGIPTHIGARDQLLRQLNSWAHQRPNWTVMLQRDHGWSSTSLMPSDVPVANNLVEANPGQLLPLLGACTACLTVSSPWSLAAMAWGRIPIIVGDYGIHDEQNTTGFFGCGPCIACAASLTSMPSPNFPGRTRPGSMATGLTSTTGLSA